MTLTQHKISLERLVGVVIAHATAVVRSMDLSVRFIPPPNVNVLEPWQGNWWKALVCAFCRKMSPSDVAEPYETFFQECRDRGWRPADYFDEAGKLHPWLLRWEVLDTPHKILLQQVHGVVRNLGSQLVHEERLAANAFYISPKTPTIASDAGGQLETRDHHRVDRSGSATGETAGRVQELEERRRRIVEVIEGVDIMLRTSITDDERIGFNMKRTELGDQLNEVDAQLAQLRGAPAEAGEVDRLAAPEGWDPVTRLEQTMQAAREMRKRMGTGPDIVAAVETRVADLAAAKSAGAGGFTVDDDRELSIYRLYLAQLDPERVTAHEIRATSPEPVGGPGIQLPEEAPKTVGPDQVTSDMPAATDETLPPPPPPVVLTDSARARVTELRNMLEDPARTFEPRRRAVLERELAMLLSGGDVTDPIPD